MALYIRDAKVYLYKKHDQIYCDFSKPSKK